MGRANFPNNVAQWSIVTDPTLEWLCSTTLRDVMLMGGRRGDGGWAAVRGMMRGWRLKEHKRGGETSFTESNDWNEASPSTPACWEPTKNIASLQLSDTLVHLLPLPGVKVLRPRLQNVWEADCEVSQGNYGIGSDHREGGALQDSEHQSDVFFTNRWTDTIQVIH